MALITGAASGLGEAMAVRFAIEGATVFLSDINVENLNRVETKIRQVGGKAYAIQHDVSERDEWEQALARVKHEAGKLNILVNNAGIAPFGSIEEASFESLEKSVEIMIYGTFFGMQIMIPYMRSTSEPCAILNMSSVAGPYTGTENNVVYNMAKSAIMGMTKGAAVDMAGSNVRVNVIHPGTIAGTAVTKNILQGALATEKLSKIPLKRFGTPEEVANAALFLCSDAASYVHGASLVVDGGQILGYRDPESFAH